MLSFPVAKNLVESRSRLLRKSDQLEHFLEVPVTAVAYPASNRLFDRHTHYARIAKTEHVGSLDDEKRQATGKICVNNLVHQRLAQRLMDWRVIYTRRPL